MLRAICCLSLSAVGMCFAADRDPCTVSKLNASTASYDMLEKIAIVVPFDRQSYFLYESQDPLVKGRAVARLCGGTEKWILYDPAYIDSIRQKDGNSDLPFYFVLAHEVAHHVRDHTSRESDWDVGYWGPKQEEDADETAAVWVTRTLRPTKEELLRAFDALGLPEQADPKAGYPSRAARRARVIQGYEEELAQAKSPVGAQTTSLKQTAPDTRPATPQYADPFRDALQNRIENARLGRPLGNSLPGAIDCIFDKCIMYHLSDLTQAQTKFREIVQKVNTSLPGNGWIRYDTRTNPYLADFRNNDEEVGVRIEVNRVLGSYEVEVDIDNLAF
jgi:hypothetical protein